MKKIVLVLCLAIPLGSVMLRQCPQSSYTTNATPLPPNSHIFIAVDNDGTGTGVDGVTMTPDPGNPAPKFSLGAATPNGINGGMDFLNGAMNWN